MSAGTTGRARNGQLRGWFVLLVLGGALAADGSRGRVVLVTLIIVVALAHLLGRPTSQRRRQIRLRTTPLTGVVIAVGVVGFLSGRVELTVLAVVLLALDATIAWWALRTPHVRAVLSDGSATVGEPVTVQVHVSRVRSPLVTQLLAPSSPLARIPADSSGALRFVPTRRGVVTSMPVMLASSGWTGTLSAYRAEGFDLDRPLIVRPRSRDVDVPPVDEGAAVPAARGASVDTATGSVRALRPYVPGDPPRRIHWPTTARTGLTMSRETEDDRDGRAVELLVALPTCPSPEHDRHLGDHELHLDDIEEVAGQALHTATQLLRAGVRVTLTTLALDGDGRPRTIRAAARNAEEVGHRLATAHPGLPLRPPTGPVWVLGPEPGPARPSMPRTGGGHLDGPPTAAAGRAPDAPPASGEVTRAPEPQPATHPQDGASSPAGTMGDGLRIFGGRLAATLAGVIATVELSRRATATSASVLVLLSFAVAAFAGAAVWRRLLRYHHAVAATLFPLTALLALASVDLRASWSILAAGAVVAAAALIAADLSVAAQRGDPALRRGPRGLVGVAAAVAAGVSVATLAGPTWGIGAAVASFLLGRSARPAGGGWDLVWIAAATAATLASAAVSAPPLLAGAAATALLGLLLVEEDADATTMPALDGVAPPPPRHRLLWRGAVVMLLVASLLPAATSLSLPRVGDRPDGDAGRGASTVIRSADVAAPQLVDPTGRGAPRNRDGDEQVVLHVEADLPAFWRTATYDRFLGDRWVSSGGELAPLSPDPPPDGHDNHQRYTVMAAHMTQLAAAPEPITLDVPVAWVQDHGDSRWVTSALHHGDVYTVVSSHPDATPATLRAASVSPARPDIVARYAAPPDLSPRVRAAVDAAAGDLPTAYDQVRALEAWLGTQVRYSLDAPLPPPGTDVVDHFLFESRVGWCEQVATTMTLALRHLGIPARLATGYVIGTWDGQRWVVHGSDAHAWVEVYFPGVGWQGFDPTAAVPLAGEAAAPDRRAPEQVPGWLLLALPLLACAALGLGLWVRHRRTPPDPPVPPPAANPRAWSVGADARLRAIGDRCGAERQPGEGAARHAARVASRLGEDALASVGRVIEQDAYARVRPATSVRDEADRVLDRGAATAARSAAANDASGDPVR
jgi:transglutaminase-like putative cysteine protease